MAKLIYSPFFYNKIGSASIKTSKGEVTLTLGLDTTNHAPVVIDEENEVGVKFDWEDLVESAIKEKLLDERDD